MPRGRHSVASCQPRSCPQSTWPISPSPRHHSRRPLQRKTHRSQTAQGAAREVPTFPRVRRSSFSKTQNKVKVPLRGSLRGNMGGDLFQEHFAHLLPAHASGCPPICLMACSHWPEAASASPCLIRSAMADIPAPPRQFRQLFKTPFSEVGKCRCNAGE